MRTDEAVGCNEHVKGRIRDLAIHETERDKKEAIAKGFSESYWKSVERFLRVYQAMPWKTLTGKQQRFILDAAKRAGAQPRVKTIGVPIPEDDEDDAINSMPKLTKRKPRFGWTRTR